MSGAVTSEGDALVYCVCGKVPRYTHVYTKDYLKHVNAIILKKIIIKEKIRKALTKLNIE